MRSRASPAGGVVAFQLQGAEPERVEGSKHTAPEERHTHGHGAKPTVHGPTHTDGVNFFILDSTRVLLQHLARSIGAGRKTHLTPRFWRQFEKESDVDGFDWPAGNHHGLEVAQQVLGVPVHEHGGQQCPPLAFTHRHTRRHIHMKIVQQVLSVPVQAW